MSVTMARPRGKGKNRVEILFYPNYSKMLSIPPRIIVPRNTIIEWVIKFNPTDYIDFYRRYGLTNFRIYFDGTTPFDWKYKNLEFSRPSPYNNEAILAEGEVLEEGEYKYGVEIRNPNYGQLYDEDPYIEVI